VNKQQIDRVRKLETVETARAVPPLVINIVNVDGTPTGQTIELHLFGGEKRFINGVQQ
jgi:hypothetical protein